MKRYQSLLSTLTPAGFLIVLATSGCGRSDLTFDDFDEAFPVQDAGTDHNQADVHTDVHTDVLPDTPPDVLPDVHPDAPCQVDYDCDDGNICTMDRCQNGHCTYVDKDSDGDGVIDEACGGQDCNDKNPKTNPNEPEQCSDGDDNDCNGLADCLDPMCTNDPHCGCEPDPGGENCGNGIDDDCNKMVDCNDPACVGTPACGCASSEQGKCHNGIDDDCDNLFDCDDSDCSDDALCACQNHDELCDNGKDDNCNNLIDCADPECDGIWPCACVPPGTPEICDDKQDNDCDTLMDCADPDCFSSPACQTCSPEICNDKIDNDCDNLVDCADPACAYDPNCTPVNEICNNHLDDDHDNLTDCADPDCKGNPYCVIQQDSCQNAKLISHSGSYNGNTTGHINYESGTCGGTAGEAVFYFVVNVPTKVHLDTKGTSFDSALYVRRGSCPNGQELACDDDSGGKWAASIDFPILYPGTYFVFVDGFTVDPQQGPNEGPFSLHVKFTPNPPEICDNGIDDDGDHLVDCADSDCTWVGKCANCNDGKPPEPEFAPGACTDGRDNDCDGKRDCNDDDCHASTYYKTECCNGNDDNGNNIPDDFACRCASNSDCQGGEICYTHSNFSCGAPCTQYYGDICPFVAPGSYCSKATGQCEF